ncbi:MAG TPA: M20 family metallopeptidase [Gaiellaceae bacterium]
MKTRAEAILSWLRTREDEMATLLLDLVREESPSLELGAERRGLALIARELGRASYRSRIVRGHDCGNHLLAVPRARRRATPYQLVLGHVDTVWPFGSLMTMPPRIDHGRLYGPGAYDMKGGLVQLVFALRALGELGSVPTVSPVVLVNADEETGSLDSLRWIRLLARGADRALVLEPPAGTEGRLKTGRKGVGRFRITVLGRASHAGTSPEEGMSAILELARQVEQLFALNQPDRGITVNVGTIDGGLRPNVVAAEATAMIDARAPTPKTARAVERAIRGLAPTREGLSVKVEGSFARPPMPRTARNRALSRRARVLARDLGLAVAEAPVVGGGSDANFTSELTATLDGLGALGDGAHALDEHVVLHALPERAALLALLLLEPAGTAQSNALFRHSDDRDRMGVDSDRYAALRPDDHREVAER